jgi:hypothetical protein
MSVITPKLITACNRYNLQNLNCLRPSNSEQRAAPVQHVLHFVRYSLRYTSAVAQCLPWFRLPRTTPGERKQLEDEIKNRKLSQSVA